MMSHDKSKNARQSRTIIESCARPFPSQSASTSSNNLHHRSLVDIVTEACSGPAPKDYHWHPFEGHWIPPWNPQEKEHVYGEVITSKAFLEADHILQSSPPEPGCDLPQCVVALMLYSDATHITQFVQAKLWPIYTYVGNGSKYVRGRNTIL